MTGVAVGGGRLTGLWIRLDHRASAIWAAVVGAMAGMVGIAFNRLYPTLHSREQLVATADSPVLRAMLGPLLAPTTTGGLVAWRMGAILTIVLGLATTFLVVRRTRAEEQAGRGSLVAASPVGRAAAPLAALADAAVLDVAACVTITIALVALRQAPGGALLLGAAIGLGAWWFGCAAAVVAQLASSAKGANGAAAAVVAVAFLLRALGELTVGWLRWASPLGWVGEVRAYADQRPVVLAVPLLTGAALAAVAAWIASRRELGRGLLPERRHASARVGATPLALAWRLERVAVVTTLAAATLYAVAIGSVVGLFNHFLHSSPGLAQAIERLGGTHRLEDAFTTAMAIFGAIAIGAWGVSMVLRLHTEEGHGRVTLLVAGGSPREAVFDGFCVVAAAASAVAVLCFGLGLGVGRALADHHASSIARGASAGMVALPAMLLPVGVATLAVGLSERTAYLAWAGVVWCALLAFVGTFLGLPQLVLDLSPFTHVPGVPLAGHWWLPCLLVLVLAMVLGWLGRAAYLRRELGGA